MENSEDLPLSTMPSLADKLVAFQSRYVLQNVILPPEEKVEIVKQNNQRCRFCGRRYPKATFEKDAHTIPNCLGNRHHISTHECDECNNKFSAYESNLKHFFGIIPTMSGTKGRQGIRPFYSQRDEVSAIKSKRFKIKGGLDFSFKGDAPTGYQLDSETGKQSFSYLKQPYRPLNVYRALLKIAISCLPDDEVENYYRLFKYFNRDDIIATFARVEKITTSFQFRKHVPLGMLFHKQHLVLNMQTHVFAFYFQNVVLQFALPLHRHDDWIYRANHLFAAICPPLFARQPENDPQLTYQTLNLSSNELKYDDNESWHAQLRQDEVINSIKMNPETGEWHEDNLRNMGKAIGFILVPRGETLPLDTNKKVTPR